MTPQSNNRRETQQPSPKYNSDMQSSSSLTYPPGLRFVPTDAELIYYYLKPFSRDNNKSWPNHSSSNIYESNPQQLSAEYKKGNLTEWFFISERTKIKRNGTKQKRGDHNGGYWHAKALTKKIKAKEGIVGYKTTLNYYNGKQPNGVRTNWLMQEYRGLILANLKGFAPTATAAAVLANRTGFTSTAHDIAYQEPLQPQPLNTIYHHQSQRHNTESEYQEPHQTQPLNTIHYHQSQRLDIGYEEPHQPQPLVTNHHHPSRRHDSAYQESHQSQLPQPQLLDAIEYQYLYQSGPLTTYDEDVIESSTQDKSNGDIKKVDHALCTNLTPMGIKRKPEEEENETRKKKKEEEGVEALKEELKQPINSHQNSDDDDSFFTGFVDTHLLDIDIESIYNCCLDKSLEKD
ncbi:hypothetical protein Bca52824_096331 [Brassica carinata]|uniref:NAC domain-containing protein n=1 Tax=Brassica carinata TaxID=52824 RepID=A0A8X7P029_BRACI|nr:hypothetical protein Bca52824_096331 [Brassica carinata]